jgi:hypothetical protein
MKNEESSDCIFFAIFCVHSSAISALKKSRHTLGSTYTLGFTLPTFPYTNYPATKRKKSSNSGLG